ncbi:MAG TPA: tetratricopeptide repeat protein [Phycisphaerae bacterium]|jgi:tetratricopeptide (TPR) repeat protein|nr:tetratricopeptide repeat protein [Phycisphaerae bacterium]HOB75436.1 tetratricopeptide repeat protein [Phycisphaerae bacterium]HOJ55631.1 tetratricopeptide repeat protein [Phycisphaerae bacterium]HOL27642.1 tetratricopeptide repeat protein [Phycisphaerae bacterium]HPP21944.1 tetratricopeptide repeat protein [Phycisphaerae bacterium]
MLTIETAGELIQTSRPRPGLGANRAILLGLAMLLGAWVADSRLFAVGEPWSWLVPQLVLLAIIGMFLRSAYLQRRLSALLIEVFESVQLQEWGRAVSLLQRVLSRPIQQPQARCELLLALGAAAEAQKQYEIAQHIYETVLEEGRGDPLQLHTARVGLAEAMLRTGQIADAVSLLDRLARSDHSMGLPDPLKAQVELVSLLREVLLGQAQDSLDRADERRRLFREHLSTRAGYGYGLLAAAFDRAQQPEQAARCWHDATLLIRPAALVARYPELEAVAARYPHAEAPL